MAYLSEEHRSWMRIAGGDDPSEGLKAGGTSAGRIQEEGDDGVLDLDISSRIYGLNIVRDVMHSLHILGHPLSQSQSADVERQCTAERTVAHRESKSANLISEFKCSYILTIAVLVFSRSHITSHCVIAKRLGDWQGPRGSRFRDLRVRQSSAVTLGD